MPPFSNSSDSLYSLHLWCLFFVLKALCCLEKQPLAGGGRSMARSIKNNGSVMWSCNLKEII